MLARKTLDDLSQNIVPTNVGQKTLMNINQKIVSTDDGLQTSSVDVGQNKSR